MDGIADEIAAVEIIAAKIEERPTAALDLVDDMARLKVASRQHWAKLWSRIRPFLEDAQIDRRKLDLAVGDEAKSIIQDRRAQERADVLRQAEEVGIPTFTRGDNAEIAWILHQELNTPETPLVYDYGRVWRYSSDTGHYRELSDAELSTRIQDWAGAPLIRGEKMQTLNVNGTRPIIELLKDRLQHATPRHFFAGSACIAVRNGTLVADLSRGVVELLPHSPDHRCDTYIDVDYDPEARGEYLDYYWASTFHTDDDAAEKELLCCQGTAAAAFGLGTQVGKKALMIVGKGGTGKSTFLRLVEALVPLEQRSYIAPQQFSDDYHGAGLAGKRLNLVFETPESDILTEAGFKAIVHGEPIRRREPYGRPLEFRPVATHMFAANTLPAAPGTTGAFWDRWALVEFGRRFRESAVEVTDLAERIITEEMAAMLAWTVRGAEVLMMLDAYSQPQSSTELLSDWADSGPVRRFAAERLVSDEDEFTPTTSLLRAYKEWAAENGHSVRMSTYTLGRRLSENGFTPKRTKHDRGFCCRVGSEYPSY